MKFKSIVVVVATTTTTRCKEEGAGVEAYLFVLFCFVEFQLRTKCVSYHKIKGMGLVRAWMDGWIACVRDVIVVVDMILHP